MAYESRLPSTLPRSAAIAAAAVCAGSLAGCSNEIAPSEPRSVASAPPEAAASPSPLATVQAAPTPSCEPTVSLDNCYAYDDMQQVAQYSMDFVHDAATVLYDELPGVADVYYIADGDTAASACSGAPADSESMFYCPVDESVYLGQAALWNFYNGAGDAAPVIAYAHEFSHHIQTMAEVPEPIGPKQTIMHENQADCMAGAIVGKLIEDQTLTEDDLTDVTKTLEYIASEAGPTADGQLRTHGTLDERSESFYEGLDPTNSMFACNLYYPETPVIID